MTPCLERVYMNRIRLPLSFPVLTLDCQTCPSPTFRRSWKMTPCLLPTPCSRRTPSRPHLLTSTPSIPSHPLIPAPSPHLPIAPAISLPFPAPIPLFPLLPQTGEMAPNLIRLPRNSLQAPHPCAPQHRQLRLCNPHSYPSHLCSPAGPCVRAGDGLCGQPRASAAGGRRVSLHAAQPGARGAAAAGPADGAPRGLSLLPATARARQRRTAGFHRGSGARR